VNPQQMISGHFAEIAPAPAGHQHTSAAIYHPSLAPQQISVCAVLYQLPL